MFASRTLGEHLARGLFGIAAVYFVLAVPTVAPVWLDVSGRVVLGLAGLLLLRGCPMCWLVGLVETVVAKITGRDGRARCVDGSCRY